MTTDSMNELHRLLREFEDASRSIERWGHYDTDRPKYERARNAAIEKIVALFERTSQ